MTEAYIYDAVRPPFGRFGGALAGVGPDDLAALVIGEQVRRASALDPAAIDEVITGLTGRERIYDDYPDVALDMVASRTFDGKIQMLEYVPTVLTGPPGEHPNS